MRKCSLLVLLAALVGCQAAVDPADPWASEFKRTAEQTTSEFARSVLQDGAVTDAEYTEAKLLFTTCMDSLGLTDVQVDDRGGLEIPDNGQTGTEVNDGLATCTVSTGWAAVSYLYFAPRTNPDNLSEGDLMAKCLVTRGAVTPTYTRNDYEQETSRAGDSDPALGISYGAEGGPDDFYACLEAL